MDWGQLEWWDSSGPERLCFFCYLEFMFWLSLSAVRSCLGKDAILAFYTQNCGVYSSIISRASVLWLWVCWRLSQAASSLPHSSAEHTPSSWCHLRGDCWWTWPLPDWTAARFLELVLLPWTKPSIRDNYPSWTTLAFFIQYLWYQLIIYYFLKHLSSRQRKLLSIEYNQYSNHHNLVN